jgi:hypothetical protein
MHVKRIEVLSTDQYSSAEDSAARVRGRVVNRLRATRSFRSRVLNQSAQPARKRASRRGRRTRHSSPSGDDYAEQFALRTDDRDGPERQRACYRIVRVATFEAFLDGMIDRIDVQHWQSVLADYRRRMTRFAGIVVRTVPGAAAWTSTSPDFPERVRETGFFDEFWRLSR